MKVHLLFPSQELHWRETPDPVWEDRFSDLELERLLSAMSGDDPVIRTVCRSLLDEPLQTADGIRYRQAVLKDCLAQPELFRQIYALCLDADEQRRGCWYRLTSPHLSIVFSGAQDLLKLYLHTLEEVRRAAEGVPVCSPALSRFFGMLRQELSEDYLAQVHQLLEAMEDRDGLLVSARFGSCLHGVSYGYRRRDSGFSRLRWLLAPTFTLAERDTAGAKDLDLRRDRATNEAVNALAQAACDLEVFVTGLKRELAFYIGALNLHDRLTALGLPLCFPDPCEEGQRRWQGLADGSLSLFLNAPAVGSSADGSQRSLCLVTGANQGGKTTFLRSMGQAQLMAQCGLFVCAEAFRFPIRRQLFTHFKREEDHSMNSGRLDEELCRMSRIVDRLVPGSMVLFNESFSSTNEWEGSELFGQITRALLDRQTEVFSVTHLLTYALSFADRNDVLYLCAERTDDGQRTFRMIQKKPKDTAFGEDIYQKVFGG